MPLRSSHKGPDVSRYEGFRGAWDKALNVFVFDSADERDRFQVAQYGAARNAFRHEWEQTDSRPLPIYPEPFWDGSEEQAAWLRAVQACPLSEYGHLDALVYLAEVAKVANGIRPVRSAPRQPLTRRQMDERLATLREQASRLDGPAGAAAAPPRPQAEQGRLLDHLRL